MKKVSVILATYNAEKYLREQIDSILNQDYMIDELIVCDDCSEDGTIEILEKYQMKNKKIILMKNEKNIGVNKTFFKLLEKATGEIIFFSDQDDVWLSSKVGEMLKKFENSDNNILVYSDNKVVDFKLTNLRIKMQFKVTKETLLDNLLFHNGGLQGCSLAINSKLKKEILTYDGYSYMHDLLISLYAACFSDEIHYIKKPLFLYRQHSKNVIGYKKSSYERILKICKLNYGVLSEEVYRTIFDFYNKNEFKLDKFQKNKFKIFFEICKEKNYFKRNYMLMNSDFKFKNKKIALWIKSLLSYNFFIKNYMKKY